MPNQPAIGGGNGIRVDYRGKRIILDPSSEASGDIIFFSHAHIDHMYNVPGKAATLASKETSLLAKARGYDLGSVKEYLEGFELLDSGHILGSRGLLVEGEVFYTGDFAMRPRAFLERGRWRKCRILIVESTYGARDFKFPPVATVMEQVNRLISDLFSRGIPVVLMGYPLGKAQVISYLFSSWDPIYLHPSIQKMNDAYVQNGVDMRNDFITYGEAAERGLLERRPWILISPLYQGSSSFVRGLKNKYGAVTVAFTGWSIQPSFKYAMALDHAFPLSDHCDFEELVSLVKACDPETVYTVHGFSVEFASTLRKMGFNAKPILGYQSSMKDYLEPD